MYLSNRNRSDRDEIKHIEVIDRLIHKEEIYLIPTVSYNLFFSNEKYEYQRIIIVQLVKSILHLYTL